MRRLTFWGTAPPRRQPALPGRFRRLPHNIAGRRVRWRGTLSLSLPTGCQAIFALALMTLLPSVRIANSQRLVGRPEERH